MKSIKVIGAVAVLLVFVCALSAGCVSSGTDDDLTQTSLPSASPSASSISAPTSQAATSSEDPIVGRYVQVNVGGDLVYDFDSDGKFYDSFVSNAGYLRMSSSVPWKKTGENKYETRLDGKSISITLSDDKNTLTQNTTRGDGAPNIFTRDDNYKFPEVVSPGSSSTNLETQNVDFSNDPLLGTWKYIGNLNTYYYEFKSDGSCAETVIVHKDKSVHKLTLKWKKVTDNYYRFYGVNGYLYLNIDGTQMREEWVDDDGNYYIYKFVRISPNDVPN